MIAWSQKLTSERAAEVGAERAEKRGLLERTDVVSIHLAFSERTRGLMVGGLVGGAEFAAMRRDAILVNTSRSPIVDEAAMAATLTEGRIGAAALDVSGEQPLPEGHRLLAALRTVLTPHLGDVTEENYRACFRGAVAAIEAWEANSPIHLIS